MKQLNEVQRWSYGLLLFVIMALISSFSVACTKDEVALNAYKTLESSKVTYYAVMDSASAMHKSGTLSSDKYEELKDAALIYVDSYLVAVSALTTYVGVIEATNEAGNELTKEEQRELLEKQVDIVTHGFNDFVKKAIQLGVDIRNTRMEMIRSE